MAVVLSAVARPAFALLDARHHSMFRGQLSRPVAPEERDRGPDLVVRENVAESGHAAKGVGTGGRRSAARGRVEQSLLGVAPGVAGSIVGRRGIAAVGKRLPPVRLSLEVATMT